jgi:hypothetical protein
VKAFIYNGEYYLRIIPVKAMFQSTMVHDVVTRGDIFAVRVRDSAFTVVPGTAQVTHAEVVMAVKP